MTLRVYFFRITIATEDGVLADTGDIHHTAITGGRLGTLVFSQPDVIFSNMQVECQER